MKFDAMEKRRYSALIKKARRKYSSKTNELRIRRWLDTPRAAPDRVFLFFVPNTYVFTLFVAFGTATRAAPSMPIFPFFFLLPSLSFQLHRVSNISYLLYTVVRSTQLRNYASLLRVKENIPYVYSLCTKNLVLRKRRTGIRKVSRPVLIYQQALIEEKSPMRRQRIGAARRGNEVVFFLSRRFVPLPLPMPMPKRYFFFRRLVRIRVYSTRLVVHQYTYVWYTD